jgi:hypothetical protein
MSRPSYRLVVAAIIAIASLAFGSGTARAAVQRADLSPAVGPTGTTVTMHVETTARWHGTETETVYLFLADVLRSSPSELHCDELAGALPVGDMTWHVGPVTFGAYSGEGFIGDMTFVVPDVVHGSYYLGENIQAVGTGCHPFGEFTVASASLPNTALPAP